MKKRYIPFSLEEYKKGHNVVTKDGNPVRIICTDLISESGDSIIALMKNYHDFEEVYYYKENGEPNHYELWDTDHSSDLQLEVNEFENGDIVYGDGKVGIYKNNERYHCILDFCINVIFLDKEKGYLSIERPADRDEIIKIFNKLAKEGKIWNSKTKKIEDMEEKKRWRPETMSVEDIKTELHSFDRVIVKDDDETSSWHCAFYSHNIGKHTIMCTDGKSYSYYLPFCEEEKYFLGKSIGVMG
jgi:hypothetical protein